MKNEAVVRQTGYYWVTYNSKRIVAYYNDGIGWALPGRLSIYEDYELTRISHTPITPEKMAAIEEILTCRDGKYTLDSMVNDILDKYKLI